MQKIPTLFARDPDNMKHVLNSVHPECEWVLDGEGVATRKYDGTCCLVRDGKFYKRHEVKPGKQEPPNFEAISTDENTGKTVGWVPVGDGPEDRWHREAWQLMGRGLGHHEGTYELVGPKVQGNPEGYPQHTLICHDCAQVLEDVPRTFDGLREWLSNTRYEGIVWHHPDGRMAKLKRRDF